MCPRVLKNDKLGDLLYAIGSSMTYSSGSEIKLVISLTEFICDMTDRRVCKKYRGISIAFQWNDQSSKNSSRHS